MNQPAYSLSVAERPEGEIARLLLSLVVPRPIAWVSTIALDGTLNLAPFSFFNAVSSRPPVVMIAISDRAGSTKDTLHNARATGELVVNIVDEELAESMNQTAADWLPEVDEFERTGLATAASVEVRPPRVAAAPVALECRLSQIVPITDSSYTLVLARVVWLHLRADLIRPNGLVDAARLRPVARLGGEEYSAIGRIFSMVRPTA